MQSVLSSVLFSCVALVCPSPPTTPLLSGLFLTLRYYTTVLEDGTPALTHVHGYLASELDHLVLAGAGAVVLVLLSGLLMAVKARLSRADGLLPLAELALNQFHTLPGLARWVARNMALVTYPCSWKDPLPAVTPDGTVQ